MTAKKPFPLLPDPIAILWIVPTIAIMAYSALFSVLPILVFILMWLSLAFYKRIFIPRPTPDFLLTILLPFIACYSTFWSTLPGTSLHTAAEYMIMVVCTVIMARLTSTAAYLKGINLGAALVLIATLLSGHNAKDLFGDTYALVGLFGSKNEVGFFAEICIFTSMLLFFMKTSWPEKIAFAAIPISISLVCLYLSKSSTSLLSLIAILGVYGGMYVVTRFPPRFRPIPFILAILAMAALGSALIAFNADVQGKVLHSVGKDSTLTGRTYLWSEGVKVGNERPILGHGYSAFWVVGQPQAERYWKEFFIPGKTGFHFHNMFIQTYVDLGFLGLCVVIFLVVFNLLRSFWLVARHGMIPEYGLALGLSCMLAIRCFVEVDWLGPFGIGDLLFFAIIPRIAAYKRRLATEQPPLQTKEAA